MIVIDSLNYIGVTVSDLEKSIQFYKEYFDFEVVDQSSSTGKAILKIGDIIITLHEVEGYSAPEKTGNVLSFCVDEEDFEDSIDNLEDAGIEIVHGPEHISNGQALVFCDPDGNRIELSYPKLAV